MTNPSSPPASITGFKSDFAVVDGVRLHYWLGGPRSGPPVILWHGFLSTGYAWREVAIRLAQAGLSVLIPDMRGYGDSDKPAGNEGYDARALAEEGRALAASIGFAAGRKILQAAHDMGALPALIWTADHPEEVAGLLYVEAPVMIGEYLRKAIAYTPEAMANGSMWWWILPFAKGVPERLIVGSERAFLTWFYEGATARPEAFDDATVNEYLRTFAGVEGVLGALGIYRAAFTSIEQTEPLIADPVSVPVIAISGVKGLGDKVGLMVGRIASNMTAETWPDSGHFVPEEQPDRLADRILHLSRTTQGDA